jgi:deoxycytidylate deaminase
MIGATMYLVGIDVDTNEISEYSRPCSMCRRLIINAGIEKIYAAVPSSSGKDWHISLSQSRLILDSNNEFEDLIQKYGKGVI